MDDDDSDEFEDGIEWAALEYDGDDPSEWFRCPKCNGGERISYRPMGPGHFGWDGTEYMCHECGYNWEGEQ